MRRSSVAAVVSAEFWGAHAAGVLVSAARRNAFLRREARLYLPIVFGAVTDAKQRPGFPVYL